MILKKQKPALLLTIGAAIALIAGGAVGYWLTSKRSQSVDLPVGAQLIPDDAMVTLSVSTSEGQWRQLRTFGTPESRSAFDETLVQLRDRLLTDNGYNYQRDIKPWIGNELTIAFLPAAAPQAEMQSNNNTPDAPSPNVLPPELANQRSAVMVLPIANPTQAQRILQQRSGKPSSERDYKGLKIQEFKEDTQTYAATVVNNQFLVVSSDGRAVEQVIDTHKGEDSIVKAPGYFDALRQVSNKQSFMQVYVNVPAARAATAVNSTQPNSSQNLAALQNFQGFAANATLQANGIYIQGITWLNPDSKIRYRVANDAQRMPNLLPESTLMMASGGNLQRLWQDYSQRSETGTNRFLSPDALRQSLQNFTGLDLDKDLIPWMSGEFSLSLITDPAAEAASPGTGLLFMVKASDRRAADRTLKQLDEMVQERYNFQVKEESIEGKSVTNWTSPFAALTISHGWMDGNVLFLGFGAPVAKTILPTPDTPLAEQKIFQDTTATKLESNNGHFFVNVERLTKSSNSFPLPAFSPQQQAFFGAIRAIGVTSAIASDRSTRSDINVLLQKVGEPSPLPSPSPRSSESPDATPEAEKGAITPSPSPQ